MKTRVRHGLLAIGILSIGVVPAAVEEAHATLITFNFQGTVSSVDASLSTRFNTTQTLSGSYTFESTTPGVGSMPDRKSTRLNSSHRCISYAVFCLKKKTA